MNFSLHYRTAAPTVSKTAKYVFIAMTIGWLALVIGGGSARADMIQLVPMRVVTAAMLGITIWMLPPDAYRSVRAPLLFLLAMALLVALQLVPLPYSMWTSLPGRALYAEALSSANIGRIWHPLTLSPDLTWNSLLALLPPALFVCGASVLGARLRSLLFMALFGTILLSGFLGLLQVAAGPDTSLRFYKITNVDSGVGLFANRNHQAVFLAMGIPIAGWLARRLTAKGRRMLAISTGASAVVFLLTAGFASQSRMGSAIIVLSLILTGLAFLSSKRPSKMVLAGISSAAILTLLVGAIAVAGWSSNRLAHLSLSEDLRVTIFPETIRAAQTFFPFGAGFGAFPQIFPRFEDMNDLQPEYFNHTHVEPTQLIIEGGAPALALLAIFLAWYVRASARVWLKRKSDDGITSDARLCSILLSLPLIASITDYPLRTPLMLCTAAALASMLHKLARRARSEPRFNQTLDHSKNSH